MAIPSHPIHTIIIEDSIDDLIFIRRALYKLGPNFVVRVVNKKDQLGFLAKSFAADLIISDYLLPGWSGLEAYLMCKEVYPFVPFVFVSGAVSKDIASETALNGATAFVLKSELEHLPQTIKNILKDHELIEQPAPSFPPKAENEAPAQIGLLQEEVKRLHHLLHEIKDKWNKNREMEQI